MRVVRAERKTWARGTPGNRSNTLLNEHGDMCCLGIYLRVCGVSDQDLFDKGTPTSVPFGSLPKEAEWLLDPKAGWLTSSSDAGRLFGMNDKSKRQVAPEKKIEAIFAKNGVDFKFVGKGVPDLKKYRNA